MIPQKLTYRKLHLNQFEEIPLNCQVIVCELTCDCRLCRQSKILRAIVKKCTPEERKCLNDLYCEAECASVDAQWTTYHWKELQLELMWKETNDYI